MPGEWGPRFYRKLTQDEELKETPVVVISGMPSAEYALKRVIATLKKPIDPDQLMSLVKDTIG
jgi:hypothetical protein